MIFQISCTGKKIDRTMVTGVYLANHNKGIDMLILKNDGTYRRIYTTFKGDQFEDSGTWGFSEGYTPRIDFNKFKLTFSAQDSNMVKANGIRWSSYFEKALIMGKIKIAIDEDSGYWYVKAGPR